MASASPASITTPPRGIYVPAVIFFHPDETINFEATRTHLIRLATAQIDGLVIQGSNGEAMHLLHSERAEILKLAREVLDTHGKKGAVIVAGCGAQSTRETIMLCEQAAEVGADYALVLSPSFWSMAMHKPVIYKYFDDVATRSPIPIILYNFPGVTSGIDLDSDLVTDLAVANPNIVGIKLTCGNMGKLQRLAHDPRINPSSTTSTTPTTSTTTSTTTPTDPSYTTTTTDSPPPAPKTRTGPFAAFAGKTDFMLPGLIAGSHGVIAATANLFPKLHIHMLHLWDSGKISEAQQLQTRFSMADWALVQLGVAGIKGALQRYYGYGGGLSRRPLGKTAEEKVAGVDGVVRGLVEMENGMDV